ncbi:MAG: hypothetical protein C3F02_01940 [Parcubacteria group bacterium]|nr:MAG: hypothetical protein C3F02_01940 [Parcubacteria group bacterium]
MRRLKIVSIASEVDPYSKTGGLADVARSLPKSLHRLGHEVIIITPFYERVIDTAKIKLEEIYSGVNVYVDDHYSTTVSYYRHELLPGLWVYLVKQEKYFSRRKELYGSAHENARFYLFDVTALKLVSLLKFSADIIHCHDWQTGLIPYLKKTRFKKSQTLAKAATVFTIHNLIFQLGHNWWEIPLRYRDDGKKALPYFDNPKLEYINFAKRAILHADIINTVSETYAQEILKRDFGQDLHRILTHRQYKLFGVVNGIDAKAFNPVNDHSIYKNYDYKSIDQKKTNKTQVQKLFKLPVAEEVPLICTTSRVTYQKGFELILRIIEPLMDLELQLLVVGAGDKAYIKELSKVAKKFPNKLVVVPSHEKIIQHENQIYAGADMILMPSHYEPCGINQLKSFRYGCVPVVRSIGGLSDTVVDYEPGNKNSNGFTFLKYSSQALLVALSRALETYRHKNLWRSLVAQVMKSSVSWELPARKYIQLYNKAKEFKNEKK